jgi:hypothetical protein
MNTARTAGLFYLVTFAAGTAAFVARGSAAAIAISIAALSYVAVTALFYFLFRPVNQPLSLVAAIVSLAGCAAGPLLGINPLPLFGVYCLLIGTLILRSSFAPRAIGILMVLAGIGWLTFALPPLATALAPFNYAPGLIGEGALTIWLLFFSGNAARRDYVTGATHTEQHA